MGNVDDRRPNVPRAPYVPADRQGWVELLRHSGTIVLRMRSVSRDPYCIWTHWISDHTELCTGSEAGCVWCDRSISQRWAGYLAVLLPRHQRQRLYCLTEGAWRAMLKAGAAPAPGTWRGRELFARRLQAGRCGAVEVRACDEPEVIPALPPPVDVPQAVANILRLAPDRKPPPTLPLFGLEADRDVAGL